MTWENLFSNFNKEIRKELGDHYLYSFDVEQVYGNESEEASWVIWSLYWEYLMNDPDKTIFSWRYYLSGYFGTEVQEFRKM